MAAPPRPGGAALQQAGADAMGNTSALRALLRAARLEASGVGPGGRGRAQRGRAQIFREHRAYVPGDDLRHIDWHAWARHDVLMTKVFEDEAPARLELLLDASASMGWAGPQGALHGPDSKLAAASIALMALASLLLGAGESVGLWATGGVTGVRRLLPAQRGRRQQVGMARALLDVHAEGDASIPTALAAMRRQLPRRCHVVVLSDLWCGSRALGLGLRQLRGRGHDVSVLRLLHAEEAALPPQPAAVLVDLEGAGELALPLQQMRASHARAHAQHSAALHGACRAAGAFLVEASMATPPRAWLQQLLRGWGRVPRAQACVVSGR